MPCFCCGGKKKNQLKTPSLPSLTYVSGDNPDVNLSPDDITLIKQTCQMLFEELNIERQALPFLLVFFKTYPEYQRVFKAFKDVPFKDLSTLSATHNHGALVMGEIKELAGILDNPPQLRERFSSLRQRHVPRRVTASQMKEMLMVFIRLAKKEAGPRFTLEAEVAWSKMIDYIMNIEANYEPEDIGSAKPSSSSVRECPSLDPPSKRASPSLPDKAKQANLSLPDHPAKRASPSLPDPAKQSNLSLPDPPSKRASPSLPDPAKRSSPPVNHS
ncbi:uncharacterized protein LOC131944684 [Physella acuta]|uniref:uncharacterized protein LOC131944684 n=1 Tax=Physella acuta TaxID=109671 RepID=UPI0027DB2E29|nr:uncharacterized protein LOC131944684 [Physella acuta]XP_059161455.1 uncharacterized protein LOC131944684 [Physella acuta]